jgi:hypothetical protein
VVLFVHPKIIYFEG